MITPLELYMQSINSEEQTTPAMMDEMSIFTTIQTITKEEILSYEELSQANITNIFVYDIPEGKKEFNIETVKKIISDIELRPYKWKNIYILRHFDTANKYSQNALLKILEECPKHAVIVLEVENPNSIFITIRSRIIDLTRKNSWTLLSPEWNEIIQHYIKKQYKELAGVLHSLKCTNTEAIAILRWVYPYLKQDDMIRCTDAIAALSSTYETPKYILNVFFL